ncbi:MAG: glycine zipper domain-containing protein [Pseudochelatococcus sp.]|uniref:glycine zipper domain-containing protein n=1 Tax=Pseudochelatococcus sp. TaxID=2020869 RepID=UPI003D8E2A81
MKQILVILGLVALVAACTPTERGAVIGGATGAAVGGAVSRNVAGAAVGGAVGATVGALIGNASEPGYCVYQDAYGSRYTAPCP